jgi:hypothetical protein
MLLYIFVASLSLFSFAAPKEEKGGGGHNVIDLYQIAVKAYNERQLTFSSSIFDQV